MPWCLICCLSDLSEVEPNVFLRPFLEVVRSEDTTGPITGLALTSVNKFLSYGLIGKIHFTIFPCKVCLSVSVCLFTSIYIFFFMFN